MVSNLVNNSTNDQEASPILHPLTNQKQSAQSNSDTMGTTQINDDSSLNEKVQQYIEATNTAPARCSFPPMASNWCHHMPEQVPHGPKNSPPSTKSKTTENLSMTPNTAPAGASFDQPTDPLPSTVTTEDNNEDYGDAKVLSIFSMSNGSKNNGDKLFERAKTSQTQARQHQSLH